MIRLPDYRYEELKQIVTDTFKKYDISCVPINAFEIAAKIGIPIVAYSAYSEEIKRKMMEIDTDGFSVYNSGKWIIFYNDEIRYTRINQTIMHEIFHVILDHKETSDVAEAEARFCAKYALAPPVLIHRHYCKSELEIMDIFDLSYEASCNAWNYYQKWLRYSLPSYTSYEKDLCIQFGFS